jgi:hypothetical protein
LVPRLSKPKSRFGDGFAPKVAPPGLWPGRPWKEKRKWLTLFNLNGRVKPRNFGSRLARPRGLPRAVKKRLAKTKTDRRPLAKQNRSRPKMRVFLTPGPSNRAFFGGKFWLRRESTKAWAMFFKETKANGVLGPASERRQKTSGAWPPWPRWLNPKPPPNSPINGPNRPRAGRGSQIGRVRPPNGPILSWAPLRPFIGPGARDPKGGLKAGVRPHRSGDGKKVFDKTDQGSGFGWPLRGERNHG